MSTMHQINHAPARMVSLHNRRVYGWKQAEGTVSVQFKRLVGRTIFKEHIRLSPEAVIAMGAIMQDFKLIGGVK